MKSDHRPCPDRIVMPRFDPDLIQAACTDGDARAIEEFSTTLIRDLATLLGFAEKNGRDSKKPDP